MQKTKNVLAHVVNSSVGALDKVFGIGVINQGL
jgi:hypothetical protein